MQFQNKLLKSKSNKPNGINKIVYHTGRVFDEISNTEQLILMKEVRSMIFDLKYKDKRRKKKN